MSEHELWNELGNLYFMSGAYDQAIKAYNKSIELEGSYGQSYSNLALAYVQKGKYTNAIELYRRSIELLSDAGEKAASLNRLGDLYRQLKVYDEALDAYQQADLLEQSRFPPSEGPKEIHLDEYELAPENSDDVEEEGNSLIGSRDDSSASQETNETVSLLNENGESWSASETQTEENAGSELLENVVETMSDQMFFIEHQVESAPLINEWQPQEVITAASLQGMSSFSREEIHKTAYENLPLAGESMQEPDQLQIDLHDDDPAYLESETNETEYAAAKDSPETMYAPVEESDHNENSLLDQSFFDEIEMDIARFRKLLQINSRNSLAWDTLGGLYKTKGQYKEALIAFQRAISIDSSKPTYYHHLGLVYSAEGRVEEAVEAFQKVIELDPRHGLAHATLGGYYKKMGLEELAQNHIGKAMKIIYESENEYNRACLEAICGNVENALNLLKIALENKQTYVDWILRDPDLDFIRNDPRFKALVADFSVKTAH